MRFSEWRAVYEPLYGDAAGRSLYEVHRTLPDPVTPDLYARRVPPSVRRLLGEYYTPPELVAQVLDRAGHENQRMLDPACGAGAFLAPCGANATGWDIHPMAVSMARRACPLARVERADALDGPPQRFELIAGNPPWVNWRNLPANFRARTKDLWARYGLFAETGLRARLGGAMDDLSALMTFVCADRHLALGGRLAFLLPAALFQTAGGGAAFRRLALPGGLFLRVATVEETGSARAFAGASVRAVIAVFEKSRTETVYPVPYRRGDEDCQAAPVAAEAGAPWVITPQRAPDSFADLRGSSSYRARVGAHTGGAAGVYWIDILEDRGSTLLVRNRAGAGKNRWPEVTAEVERDLVHPLVRGRDLRDGAARASGHILLPHARSGKPFSESEMGDRYPLAFGYFEHFRTGMIERPHYRQHFKNRGWPYWSMYNVGPYTFARHRVAWREQSSKFECAMVEAGDIADAKLVTVALECGEEARYLADFLNQARVRAFVESYAVRTQISTHVMRYLRVPPFQGLR